MSFIVFALPRSRTFWLSQFLSQQGWYCGHDEAARMRSLSDIKAWFSQPYTGTIETAAAPWWRLIYKYNPELKFVILRRPIDQVVNSLLRCGLMQDKGAAFKLITKLNYKLDQIEKRIPCKTVEFDQLNDENICNDIFEYCTGIPGDSSWCNALQKINLQINVPALQRYCTAYQKPIENLIAIATQAIKSDLVLKPVKDINGVTFQEETLSQWGRDAQELFRQHCFLVEESPENFLNKNWELAKQIENVGRMQIITARCNGKMFGYLMAILAPSLEEPGRLTGNHLTFFASPEIPGLGLKLQRVSVIALKNKNVKEIFWRAGVRGDGPRLKTLYKRLGGENYGQLFRLNLMED
jgi:hypothetical protein